MKKLEHAEEQGLYSIDKKLFPKMYLELSENIWPEELEGHPDGLPFDAENKEYTNTALWYFKFKVGEKAIRRRQYASFGYSDQMFEDLWASNSLQVWRLSDNVDDLTRRMEKRLQDHSGKHPKRKAAKYRKKCRLVCNTLALFVASLLSGSIFMAFFKAGAFRLAFLFLLFAASLFFSGYSFAKGIYLEE